MKAVQPNAEDTTFQRVWKKLAFLSSVGRNAIIVIICTGIAYSLRESQPFHITGEIDAGFPPVGPPPFSVSCGNGTSYYSFGSILSNLGAGIVIVPLVAVIENIAIASAFAGGKAIDATQVMHIY